MFPRAALATFGLLGKGQAKVIVGFHKIRINLQGLAELRDGFLQFPFLKLNVAKNSKPTLLAKRIQRRLGPQI
jgi:hypothetical protein